MRDRLIGTPGFQAPEVLEKGLYSKETDVYAVAKTLQILFERNKVGDMRNARRVEEERSFEAYFE